VQLGFSEVHISLPRRKLLFYKFGWLTLKPLFALQAAEMDRFAIISDFKLGCAFIQNHAADWVSKHMLGS